MPVDVVQVGHRSIWVCPAGFQALYFPLDLLYKNWRYLGALNPGFNSFNGRTKGTISVHVLEWRLLVSTTLMLDLRQRQVKCHSFPQHVVVPSRQVLIIKAENVNCCLQYSKHGKRDDLSRGTASAIKLDQVERRTTRD